MGSIPINKNRDCHLEVFYQGPISQVLFYFFLIKVFIGILGESFDIQFFGNIFYRF